MWTRYWGQNSQTKKNLGFESRGSSQAALVPNHPPGPQRSPLDADRKVSSLRVNMSKLSCIIIILFRFDLALRTDRPAAGRPHTWALPTIYRCNYCTDEFFDTLCFKNLMTPRFPCRWGDIASGHQLGRRLFGPPHTGAIVKIAHISWNVNRWKYPRPPTGKEENYIMGGTHLTKVITLILYDCDIFYKYWCWF